MPLSWFLGSSMAALAASASLRRNILTKAWRLSLLTMHVWTLPYLEKSSLSSLSGHLSRPSRQPWEHNHKPRLDPASGRRRDAEENLRNTAYKQGAAVHLDRAVGHGAVHLDPLLPRVAVRRAVRSATGRRALSVLGHAAAPAITIVVPARTGTWGGRTPVVIEAPVVGPRTRGAAGSPVPAAGRRAGSRPPATTAGRSGAIVVAVATSIITITRSIRSRHVPRAGARRGRRAWRDSIP